MVLYSQACPPPPFSRFWGRLIGLTKSTLKSFLGRTHATLKNLQILVTKAVLNNCPLTYSSPDVDDPCLIPPARLLYGRPIITVPHYDAKPSDINDPIYGDNSELQRRAMAQAAILNYFWGRWSKEYLMNFIMQQATMWRQQR